jgi:hypothetical protein
MPTRKKAKGKTKAKRKKLAGPHRQQIRPSGHPRKKSSSTPRVTQQERAYRS